MRVESISESKRREPKRLLVSIVVHILSNPCKKKKKEQPLPNFFFFFKRFNSFCLEWIVGFDFHNLFSYF
jgi:hypothetical protein